ncbi:hypothetical protein GEV33_014569 [Tenebrio molitor]|uniref:Uncharacterized protein n=1 Tax=Tenebrio molitor TaxID=7067 RepID=A0A8J6L6H2_TENMO|nr:hypothetical protein GEV33_014569 [Tenebrio molitor]
MQKPEKTQFKRKIHPKDRANCLSQFLFCWQLPIIIKYYKNDFTEENLYPNLAEHSSEGLGNELEEKWHEEEKSSKRPSLFRVLYGMFGRKYIAYGVLMLLLELATTFLTPLCLKQFLKYFDPQEKGITKQEACMIALAIVLLNLLRVLYTHRLYLEFTSLGIKVQIACSTLVYRKYLKLKKETCQKFTLGQMVNLLSNDVERFHDVFAFFHNCWIGPLKIVLGLYYLDVVLEAKSSLQRIEKFLLCEHQESQHLSNKEEMYNKVVNNSLSPRPLVLNDVNLEASSGELVGVAGAAGSGKSTLLQVILKEIEPTKGFVDVEGAVSYAVQEAWIFSASVRQNILFGQEMDQDKYQKVIRVCALGDDLSLFPHGDQTLVGERGVMLSGGQKARISLARAVYRDADIYLLDDPLSAVDAHVAEHIFNECILNYLKSKSVVLVTHQIKYLSKVNQVYFIENGKLTAGETLNKANKYAKDNNTETIALKKYDAVSEVKEHRSSEATSPNPYKKYCFAGHWLMCLFILLMFGFAQFISSSTDFFVAFWIDLTENPKHFGFEWKKIWSPQNFLTAYASLTVGLAITQSLDLIGLAQAAMKMWSDVDATMTSVERVLEYTDLTPEEDNGNFVPQETWPQQGNVEFKSVTMQYSPEKPMVLNQVCFTVKSGEKLGIVGRTGAGKTSLVSALFRLFHFEGTILIDGVDTKSVPLQIVRAKISIIPQDPVLFIGSLRKNLDPFGEYSDCQIWQALEEVQMKNLIVSLPSGLETVVIEGGNNFSVGQKQLLCLVRAILRNAKIIVLDEATAKEDSRSARF